jgi:hypothetical protein
MINFPRSFLPPLQVAVAVNKELAVILWLLAGSGLAVGSLAADSNRCTSRRTQFLQSGRTFLNIPIEDMPSMAKVPSGKMLKCPT